METDCNSMYDGSPDVSVEEEEEEEEDEEAQGHRLTSRSLEKLNQNEETKSKLSEGMDAIQSEDSGLPWETSSSRCSTSLASETSATSGNYNMENSCTLPVDDKRTAQKRTNTSPDQAPLSPNENIGPESEKYDFSSRPMQIQNSERELDPADPQSWPFQVQPSKIKDYLVQITQEVDASVPEEKENALMKKGELPLKGTVRARIQQITAVLEERNKKIFRRVNQKDVPPPSDVIRKPREQPKVFSRHGISVSLRHIEQEPPDKHKKEILSYNLRHVETNISKSGYNEDEKRVRRFFPPEAVGNTSERLPTISSRLANKARKSESKLYSPAAQSSTSEQAVVAVPNRHKETEEEKQPLLEGTANVMPEKSSNLGAGTERQNMTDYSSVTKTVTDPVDASEILPQRETAQFHPPISAEPPSSLAQEGMSDATVTVLLEPAARDVPCVNNIAAAQPQSDQFDLPDTKNQVNEFAVPLQQDIKGAALLHSAEEVGTRNILLDSPETAESSSEHEEWPSPSGAGEKEEPEVSYSEKEEAQEHRAVLPQAESVSVYSVKEPEVGETGTFPDLATTSGTEILESQSNLDQTGEDHLGLPQPSYLMGEVQQKEKECLETDVAEQVTQPEKAVPASLEAGQANALSSKGEAEKEMALSESPEVPLSVSDTQREETCRLSAAVSQAESQHPIISETTKAPEVSESAELSFFKDEEVGLDSAAEASCSPEQLPSVSSHLSEKQDILPSSLVSATPSSEQLKPVLPYSAETVVKQSYTPCSPETAPVMAEPPKEQGPLPCSPETPPPVAEPIEKQGILPYALETAPVVSEQTEKQCPQPCVPEITHVIAEPTNKQSPLSYYPEIVSVVTEAVDKPSHIPYSPESVPVMVEPMEKQGPLSYSPETASIMAEPTVKQSFPLSSPEIVPIVAEPGMTQGPLPFSLDTVPVVSEAAEEQGHLAHTPEIASLLEEALVVVQNDGVPKVGIQPALPTDVPSEEGVSLSREPDVVSERKAAQLVSPLSSAKLPNDVSAPSQEEVKSESQLHPPANGKMSPVDEKETQPTTYTGLQKSQSPSLTITPFDLDHSAERKQSMERDSSVPSQLAETIVLSLVDEAAKKSIRPDIPIAEPLKTDLLHPACVLEEQGRAQVAVEETTEQQSHTSIATEADILRPVEETKINGILPHLPSVAEDLCQPIYLMETQEDHHFSKGTTALDSRSLSTPYITDEVEKCDSTETESKDSARQAIQTEFEAEYQNVSFPATALGKPVDASFPAASTGEDLRAQRSMNTQLASEQPVSSEIAMEVTEFHSVITPAPKMKSPVAYPETQKRQDSSCDVLNEASKPSPLISSLVTNQPTDQGVLAESVLSSAPTSEQPDTVLLDVEGKDDRLESQFFITPKMEEAQSFISFLVGEAGAKIPSSVLASETMQQLSRSIPDDVISSDANDKVPPSSPLSAAQLPNQIISSCVVTEGEKEGQTPLLLNEESKSTKEVRNEDSPLSLPSMTPSASLEHELLYYQEESKNQERKTLEKESLKEEEVVQNSSILQQEPEHLNLQQLAKELQRESLLLYPSAAVQSSSQTIDTTGTGVHQDSLPETAFAESICERKVEEIHPVWFDAAQLEHKPSVLSAEERANASHPLGAAALDLGHLDPSYSMETQFSSLEVQNQASEQKLSVSSLLKQKMVEQEVSSHPLEVSVTSALSQSTCAPEDEKPKFHPPGVEDMVEQNHEIQNQTSEQKPSVASLLSQRMVEQEVSSHPSEVSVTSALSQPTCAPEDEKPKFQPHPPGVEDMVSLAAFLLSEASAIDTSSPPISEEENLDAQTPCMEAGLLTKRPESAFAAPSEISKTMEEKTEHSAPQADANSRCSVHDGMGSTSDTPVLLNFTQNEFSSTIISEPINDTHVHNLISSVSSIASETVANKDVISTGDLAKTEAEESFSHAEETLNDSEASFKKEEKIRDYEVVPDLSQATETVDISATYEVVGIDVPPLISSIDTEEDTNVPESLECLEIASLPKAKPVNDIGNVAADKEPLAWKPNGETSGGLKPENREYKEKESKAYIGKNGVQGSIEINLDLCDNPENQGDEISKLTNIDYVEKFILIDDTSVTQTGKEKYVEEAQSSSEMEIPSSAARSENTEFSLLERDLGNAFQGVQKEKHVAVTHEDISEVSDNDKIINTARENGKKPEGGLNMKDVGVPLPSTKEDELSFLISLPVTEVKSDVPEMPPALAFLYNDFYEEAASKQERSPSEVETLNTDLPIHIGDHAPDDTAGILPEMGIPEGYIPRNLKETQNEDESIHEQVLSQTVNETNEEEYEFDQLLDKTHAQTGVLALPKIREDLGDTATDRPVEIVSDITVETCKPTHAIPFGSGLFRPGASSDDSSQQREESVAEETGHVSPEETSDEESTPIFDYAASVYQNEASVQDEPSGSSFGVAHPLAVDQSKQSEVMAVHDVDTDVVRKTGEQSTQQLEAYQDVSTQWQSEGQQEDKLVSALEPMSQEVQTLDREQLPYWGAEENRVEEVLGGDLLEQSTEAEDQLAAEANYDRPFGELDYSVLSHEFDTHPLYSIKEEEYSDIDEDLAELMDYEMVTHNDVFQEETSSEAVCEELLFDEKKSLDHISDSYVFVNEREASIYADEEAFELMESDKLSRNIPESEILQKETVWEQLDAYCYQCQCPILTQDKLFGEHQGHDVTDLDKAVKMLKSQLDGFQDVLQERSIKIEEFVSEIEALFNSLEENCKEKERLLEEQNESIVKMVIDHHERRAQSFEGIKNTKMEYLYEQMVNFQEYIDTAKETLETIVKESEEMDDFVFLQSSEEINKRLLSAVENILTLEKMPDAFSQFEHYTGGTANGDQTLKHTPVPQTPKLHPQEPNSATSTSIAVYWTVDEDAIIDFFQVYCMEKYPGSKEQSGLVEEYRVTVKESNCILEDLEPGHSYSVWVMAVNYAGCSFPSEKSTFRTAPPTPVMKAEECTVCWDTATIRWSTSNLEASDSFTLEYCRQYSPEGEGLRSLAGIKRPEMKIHLESNVNYFFYVRAVNVFGASEQSEAALISTKGTRFHIMKETAHPALYVSPNGTMICLPEDAKLTRISPVLGELLSARGRHYWETTVSGCEAYRVGICYSTVPQDGALGQNNTSWCFHCSSKTSFVYQVLHNGEMSDVIVTEQPARIGILLDYNAGRLLFFNAERGQVLSSIRHKFTDVAHPAFLLEQPGVLNLHTGMELPEFVKQS